MNDERKQEATGAEPAFEPGTLRVAPQELIPTDNPFGELRSTTEVDDHADDRDREARDGPPDAVPGIPITRKFLFTAVGLGALIGLPYAPDLFGVSELPKPIAYLRVFDDPPVEEGPDPVISQPIVARYGEEELPGPTTDQQDRAAELELKAESNSPLTQRPDRPAMPGEMVEAKVPILDPSNKALEAFFTKLDKAERGEAGSQARILYYGDSIVASDFVTGMLRRLYQSRFGDSGHGYALIANAWPGWFHIDVSREASPHWKVSRCVTPYNDDGFYGLGCVSFVARQAGAWYSMGTADRDEWGRKVSAFEVEYFRQPGGGSLQIKLDGENHEVLDTDGEAGLAYHTIEVDDGPHEIRLETMDDDEVRLFGTRMERDKPGVILSALGITGARARFLDKQDDEHWAEVLKAAKPDLVVLAFGSNEATDGRLFLLPNGQKSDDPIGSYEETLRVVMKQVEAAVPDASYMLVGPPDMASKKAEWAHSRPIVPTLVASQIKLAEEEGWAFFNQFEAMGGTGSMWAWMQSGLGNADMFHPTGAGGNVLARMQFAAMMKAYDGWKEGGAK